MSIHVDDESRTDVATDPVESSSLGSRLNDFLQTSGSQREKVFLYIGAPQIYLTLALLHVPLCYWLNFTFDVPCSLFLWYSARKN